MRFFHSALLVLLALLQVACATYQGHVSKARDLLEKNKTSAALDELKPLAETESKDQLIYVLDYATALQAAGDYKKSSQEFMKADKLADLQDYTSVTKEVGSLLFAEELVQYKGEDFEKLLISSMSAINYALMGDLEGARVETRRSTDKLNYFRVEQKKEYDDNSFVHYLNGHIWESTGDYDSAYIDFRKAFDMGINNPMIQQDMFRVAMKGHKNSTLEDLRRKFSIKPDTTWQKKNYGELVVIYQQGWGPRKRPNPQSPRFPILVPEGARTKFAKVEVKVEVQGLASKETVSVYDLEKAAIKTLNDQYGKLVAKRIAGMVAKDVAAKQISKKNEGLGLVAFIAMHASDRADLRQWSTLPSTIQIARFDLPAGEHEVRFIGLDSSGSTSGENSESFEVNIRPGKKTFLGWRSFQ